MAELLDFGRVVLLVAAGFSLALASSKLTERFPLPGPAIFLLAAALASDLFPALADHVSIREVERIGVVALIAILFDAGVAGAQRLYGIVFVVAFSVVVQGTSIPLVAARLGVPMRTVEREPWNISVRLRNEPSGARRFVVAAGSRADGATIRDLPLAIGPGSVSSSGRANPCSHEARRRSSRATRCSS